MPEPEDVAEGDLKWEDKETMEPATEEGTENGNEAYGPGFHGFCRNADRNTSKV